MNQQLGRALRFVTPYWRRLILVLALSLASTGFSLSLPLLTRDFFDRALLGRDLTTLVRVALLFAGVTVAGFVVNAASGLRYTRGVGRHPVRHAAGDVSASAATVAAVLRTGPSWRHPVAD